MRFTVIGTDTQTGGEMELTFEAKTADHAEHLASQRGINVQRVKIASSEVGQSTPAMSATATATMNAPRAVQTSTPSPAPARWTAPIAPAPKTAPAAAPARTAAPLPAKPAPTPQPRTNNGVLAALTNPTDRPRSLGLVALGLGGVGLLFCWIPVIGMISVPLCLIGAAAGGFGAWLAKYKPASTRPTLGHVALPVGGAVLSVFSLAIAVLVAFGPSESSATSQRAAPADLPSTKPATAQPERPHTIVGSHASGDSESIFTAKPAPAKPSGPATPPAPVSLGSVEVTFVSARIESVLLIGEQGRQHGESNEPMLVVKLSVRNKGEAPIEYLTFGGDENNLDARAAVLTDERGVRYRRATFEMGINPVGRVPHESLAPGRTLTDSLVFHTPPASVAELSITLQGRAVGTNGTATMNIPAALIQR